MGCGHSRSGSFQVAASNLEADSSEFFVGNVPGCGEAPPDYTEGDDATIRGGLPIWTSTFEPVHAVFLGPAPSDARLSG
jgi:hypothetical protein